MKVILTQPQIMQGALIGCMRQVSALKKGSQNAYGYDGKTDWQINIEGCLAEMAVAQYRGVFWDGRVGVIGPGDVGHIEVRSTVLDDGCLIVHPKDGDDVPFVLVTGQNGKYELRGWLYGREAKHDCYWRKSTGRPAWFVPQGRLHAIEDLPDE